MPTLNIDRSLGPAIPRCGDCGSIVGKRENGDYFCNKCEAVVERGENNVE